MNAAAEPLADVALDDDDVFVFPATAAQRRFWTLHGVVPGGNPALNMPLAIRLSGRLDPAALERSINAIVARHEALRTTFHLESGSLSQLVAPSLTIPLPLVDAEDFPEGERARVPDHLMREEAELPFDLARGPLVRARLVRNAPADHLLLLTLHHIISDGWSNGLILRELTALYHGQSLPPLDLQFADYVEHLEKISVESQLAHWRRALAAPWAPLGLPGRKAGVARARVASAEGVIHWRALPAPLARDLKALAAREGASPYMVSLAVFALLLHRAAYGQPSDLVICSPSANRTRAEIENVVGLFVNPILLRLDLSGDPAFRELLSRVRQTTLDAFANADAPFERVVEETGARHLQVNFLHQAAFLQPSKFPDLTFTPLRSLSGGAVFEWTVGAIDDQLCLEYNAELFDEAAVTAALDYYQTLLEEAAAAPEMRLSQFSASALHATDPSEGDAAHGKGAPYLTLHYQLIEIWQEILGVQPIGIRDDFFALGGNSLLALRMLTRVELACGKALQPATLFERADIEHLADELLTREEREPSGILTVRASGDQTPFFYLHGDLTGGGYYCMKLARGLGAEQPFYALPPIDVNAVKGRPSVAEMAAMHVEAIRSVRPQGPYRIGGFCLGGLIAYEVAQQLRAAGETVERLVIIDATVENDRFKKLRRWAERVGRLRGLDADTQLHLFCRWHFLLARAKRAIGLGWRDQFELVWRKVRTRGKLEPVLPRSEKAEPGSWYDPRWDAPLVFLWAAGGYYAKPYEGAAALLLSTDLSFGPERNPARDWEKLIPHLQVRTLPGSHLACITDHVDALAETLRAAL